MADPFSNKKKALREAMEWGDAPKAVREAASPEKAEPTYQPKRKALSDTSTTSSSTTTSSTTTTQPKEQDRKEYGIGYGDQDNARNYLGHFANEKVLKAGHNVGYNKLVSGKGKVKGDLAKRGYRVIPGSASPQIGVADAFIDEGIADLGLKLPEFERKTIATNKKWIKKLSERDE